ncbi:MAG TPA: type II CAAX endopeptidase family protein [Casimicrobiaceae bacterium]|nr:type II CAAX endopeptidase family protein [Casimicrobiaceae bacterium]
MSGITRRPAFWIAFALVSAFSGALAWRYFPQAIPLINLEVRMSREDALAQAAAIADRLHLAAPNARAAALFTHDGSTQNFVELDAGGKPAFARLLAGDLYAPYRWEVRLFHPGETAEARIGFKPDGTPYGFVRKLPETAPGPALDAEAARAIGEKSAREDWGIDFAPYKLIEQSHTEQPSHRVDHLFTYERQDQTLGDGRVRLRLVVAGDALSGLQHFVFVPEAFGRRFQEMRSANNTIANVATLSAGVLYGLGGCILGVLWLLRKRWLLWKPALAAGAVVAGINALALLANSPQAWFSYDTAQSTTVFWAKQFGIAAVVAIGGGLALALVFMAAESLSRRAFPDHPQLWRLWSRDAAPTRAVLGRTLGGYLFVPIELGLIAAFYVVTNRYFGWWQPSEMLTDPNILGSALPGLSPVGMALQAGFLEECLFRAVPLSLAALIGAHFGARRTLIGVALVAQALIFAAAHANYPGFPAYSRLVELFGPALIWGLIFLRFGLLPTIILHALFDLVLMSIPLLLVAGRAAELNQAIVVAAALVPLFVVLVRRTRTGAWLPFPPSRSNGAWSPAPPRARAASVGPRAAAGTWAIRFQRALPVLALAGVLFIALTGNFRSDAPPLSIGRAEAEAAADAALAERGVKLSPEWKRYATIRVASGDAEQWQAHNFVWREAGHDAYRKLVGNWLAPPSWEVRYARFDGGDVAERAEEWRVTVEGTGKVRSVRHRLPEQRAGSRLSRDEAAAIANRELHTAFDLDPSTLREVEVKEDPQPARTDWQFTLGDPRVNAGKGGEARAGVYIAGDEVGAYGRYVFVPEDWQRAERERASRLELAKLAVVLVLALVGLGAIIWASVAWTRDHFDRRAFWVVALLSLGAALINAVDQWPSLAMGLQTTEPVMRQVALASGRIIIGAVVGALLAGMLSGVASYAARVHVAPDVAPSTLWLRGAAVGLFVIGVDAVIELFTPQLAPLWPKFGAENAAWPWLSRVATSFNVLLPIAGTIVVLSWLDRLTSGWTRHRVLCVVLLVLGEGAISAMRADQWLDIVMTGLIGGLVSAALFAFVLRFDLRQIPALIGVYAATGAVVDALEKASPQAWLLSAIAVLMAIAISWVVTNYLVARGPIPADSASAAGPEPTAAPG